MPFAVAKLPAAYTQALRDTYDDSKMFWASCRVMSLTQGFYSVVGETVTAEVNRAEKNSLRLVENSLGQSKSQFAATLNKNALKIFGDRKNLYEQLMLKYNGGTGVKYDENNLPAPDAPTSY